MAYAPEEVADMAAIAGAPRIEHRHAEPRAYGCDDHSRTIGERTRRTGPAGPGRCGCDPFSNGVGAADPKRSEGIARARNAAEVAHLAGEAREIKGVDAGNSTGSDHAELAVRAARELGHDRGHYR